MNIKLNKYTAALAVFFSILFSGANAHATFVAPKRVMINDGQTAAAITIQNRNKQAMIYRFDWERRPQAPDGTRLLLKKGETSPGYRPADEMLVFSPRQVIIQPGQTQRVRILARRPSNIQSGEYHSHLLIIPDPVEEEIRKQEQENTGKKGLAGNVQMKTRLAIPVFLRQGKTSLNFNFLEAKIAQEGPKTMIKTVIENNSTRSIYAKPVMECTKANGETVKTTLPTLRLYAEAKRMNNDFTIPKSAPPLNECNSLKVVLEGLQDPEYHSKPIREIILKP